MNPSTLPVCDLPSLSSLHDELTSLSQAVSGNCNDDIPSKISSGPNTQCKVELNLDASLTKPLFPATTPCQAIPEICFDNIISNNSSNPTLQSRDTSSLDAWVTTSVFPINNISLIPNSLSDSTQDERGLAAIVLRKEQWTSETMVGGLAANVVRKEKCTPEEMVGGVAFNASHEKQCTAETNVGGVGADASKEKQCTLGTTFIDSYDRPAFCSAPKLPMEAALPAEDDDDDAIGSPRFLSPTLLLSCSDSENPCSPRPRKDDVLDSDSVLRAPMKPVRVRSLSLSSFNPGKTRRRLDFDHL